MENTSNIVAAKEYIYFIAQSLISFITLLFQNPIESIKIPKHLFAIGHIVLIIGLLIPSGTSAI